MLVQYYYPLSLSPARLDRYLAAGWFRNAALLYRSQLVCLESDFFSVMNIRMRLRDYEPKKSLRKILKRNNKLFTIILRPAFIDEKKEALYTQHKKRFEGFVYTSLSQFFYGDFGYHDVFDTYEICIFDGSKLIAVSFFDKGKKSMASLLGIFDNEYAKYSLGLYTMILEAQYGQSKGLLYYYPGYILDRPSIFDYKLRLGKMEYYNWRGKWTSLEKLKKSDLIGNFLRKKIKEMENCLTNHGLTYNRYLYPLFSVGYFEVDFIKSTVYLSCHTEPRTGIQFIIEFDIESKEYILSRVSRESVSHDMQAVCISEKFLQSDFHFLDLLTYEEFIETSPEPEQIIKQLKRFV